MSEITSFEADTTRARVMATSVGWRIDLCSPQVQSSRDFRSAGEAAEYAALLRDEGGWPLRFSYNAAAVELLVKEIDAERP